MHRRTFLSFSIAMALHPPFAFASSDYYLVGNKKSTKPVADCDLLKQVITEMKEKVEKLSQQASRSSVESIIKLYDDFANSRDKVVNNLDVALSSMQKRRKNKDYKATTALYNVAFGAIAIVGGLAALIFSAHASLIGGVLLFVGAAQASYQIVRTESLDFQLLLGHSSNRITLLGSQVEPFLKTMKSMFATLLSIVGLLWAAYETWEAGKDYYINDSEADAITQHLTGLQGNIDQLKSIDTREKFQKVYIKQAQESVNALEKYYQDTQASGCLIEAKPHLLA